MLGQRVTVTNRAQRGESTSAAPAAIFLGFSWSKKAQRSHIEAIFLPSLLLFLCFSLVARSHVYFLGAVS